MSAVPPETYVVRQGFAIDGAHVRQYGTVGFLETGVNLAKGFHRLEHVLHRRNAVTQAFQRAQLGAETDLLASA